MMTAIQHGAGSSGGTYTPYGPAHEQGPIVPLAQDTRAKLAVGAAGLTVVAGIGAGAMFHAARSSQVQADQLGAATTDTAARAVASQANGTYVRGESSLGRVTAHVGAVAPGGSTFTDLRAATRQMVADIDASGKVQVLIDGGGRAVVAPLDGNLRAVNYTDRSGLSKFLSGGPSHVRHEAAVSSLTAEHPGVLGVVRGDGVFRSVAGAEGPMLRAEHLRSAAAIGCVVAGASLIAAGGLAAWTLTSRHHSLGAEIPGTGTDESSF